jgi:hypothetical protein
MSFTLVETDYANKRSPIMIKPYFDRKVNNLGLEQYGMVLYDRVYHQEQLSCLENNGIKRYVTGLNEFAPDIKNIPDAEQREAKIKEIRNVVSNLEKDLASNVVNPEDPEFWAKVKLLRPDNDEFWSKIELKCGNEPLYLDPAKDPYDLIKLYAINAGGFSIVAKSLEDARNRPFNKIPKFYLDKFEETVSTKTETKKLRNKALAELQKLFDKNTNKLFYIAKMVEVSGSQYKKSTPNDLIYDNMDKFIMGEGSEKNAARAAQMFLDVCNQDMESLKLRSIVKDSAYFKFIISRADGFIYHKDKAALLGRNQAEIVEFLRNPLNEELLIDLQKRVEKYWNQ